MGGRSLGNAFSLLHFEETIIPGGWSFRVNLKQLLLFAECSLPWTWCLFNLALTHLLSWALRSTKPCPALLQWRGSSVYRKWVSCAFLPCFRRHPSLQVTPVSQTLDPGLNPVLGGWWTLGCLRPAETTSPLWLWRDWPQGVSILAQGSMLCPSTTTHLGFLFQGRDTLDFSLIQSFHVKTFFFYLKKILLKYSWFPILC